MNFYSKLAKSYFVTVYQLSTSKLLWNGLTLPLRATQLNVKKNDCHNQPEIKVFESRVVEGVSIDAIGLN